MVESFGMLEAFYPRPHRPRRGPRATARHRVQAQAAVGQEDRPPRQWREVDGVVIPLPFDLRGLLDTERVLATMGILQQPEAVSPDFADQLGDILAMLDGTYEVGGFDVHAVPGERSGLTPWIFGSTRGQSARVAGAHGLPFVASYHITPATALEAIEAYRDTFVPSATLQRALRRGVRRRRRRRGQRHRKVSRRRLRAVGVFDPDRGGRGALSAPPSDCRPLTEEQLPVVKDRLETQFVGDPDEVAERLSALQRLTGADELVVTSVTHDHEDRLRSHQLLAQRWGLGE